MRVLSIILLISFSTSTSFASFCTIDNFCETVTISNETQLNQSYQINHAKILSQETAGVRVQVLDLISGNITENEFFINNGITTCDLETSHIKINNEFIFATSPSLFDAQENYLSICGVTVLSVQNNIVTQNISPNTYAASLDDFKANIGNCNKIKTEVNINVFPNPAQNHIRL